MPKLIEIIGAPGTGKTYISQKLQSLTIKNKQICFHSSDTKNFNKFKKLSFIESSKVRLKTIFIIIKFYFFFNKRIFLKKIYIRTFFFRVIMLTYKHLTSIELFKKVLSDDKYLIIEPGIIMYFIQDYFYIKNKIPAKDISLFNEIFVKADKIICLNCNYKTQMKRLTLRKKGLPQRMKDLRKKNIFKTIKKSNSEIRNYILNSCDLENKIINIDTSKKIKNLRKLLG